MNNPFFSSLWPGVVSWILLYVSDYSLTIVGARLYQSGPKERIVFEGSYELTPFFQRDIDALRVISPRFLAALAYATGLLTVVWFLAARALVQPLLYEFTLGAMILSQLAVHLKHLRNISLFRALRKTDAVRGRIEYSRPLILRVSSHEWFAFSGFFALLFLFTQVWFFAGGVAATLSLAIKHRKLATRASAHTMPTVQPSQEA